MRVEIIKKVSQASGISEDVCSKVINSLESVMQNKDDDGSIIDTITDAISGIFGKK